MEQERIDREKVEEARRREEEEWRVAIVLKDKEASAAQQTELRLANEAMLSQQAQQQQYTALLARLPKFEGKQMPTAFILSLEKQLCDSRIPEDKWLQALEACLQGKALSSYWTLVEEGDRKDYESAKHSVLRCLRSTSWTRYYDYLGHVGNGKMAWILKQTCCWPGMSGDAKRYGRACAAECQRMRKGGLAEVPMGEMPIHKTPFENVAVDIVGHFPRSHGFKYILTYICLASRYPEAIPLRQATAQRLCWRYSPGTDSTK